MTGVGYVDQTGAFIIGLITGTVSYQSRFFLRFRAGIICYFAGGIQKDSKFQFEDLHGAFTINYVASVIGVFLLGFFSNNRNGQYAFKNGAFYGNPEQVISFLPNTCGPHIYFRFTYKFLVLLSQHFGQRSSVHFFSTVLIS
jgi:ammonia channel protein AmtB